jgi:hypothetical protein
VDKSLDAVKKEIDEAARKIPFPRVTEAAFIQPAELPRSSEMDSAIFSGSF